MWLGLRDGGRMPTRAEFRPAKAARFLREIVLLEVPRGIERRVMVRLVGTTVEARLQTNIVRQDYLQYLPEIHREGAWRSCRMMAEHPCGLWQMSNLRYERGISNLVEMTMFPLAGTPDGPQFVLVHLNFMGTGADSGSAPRAISADTALTFRFLDVGAGLPAWAA